MKLESLRTFRTELRRELDGDLIQVFLHYFWKDKWYALETEALSLEVASSALERARKEEVAYHATNSPDAWYYMPKTACGVQLTFPKSPQLATRKRYQQRILKIREGASNAYRVTHNPLTHLLARDAFRERLSQTVSESEKRQSDNSNAQEGGTPPSLAVLALDIDHFKQVNDTWGHLYGDQVLKAFGRRLEQCAETIRMAGSGRLTIYLGHPSGEEFLVLIFANATRDQLIAWANEFRKEISDAVLPTDVEWEWLSTTDNLSSLSPPPIQERGTTVSVGLAFHNSATKNNPTSESISNLLDRADTALYRAKAAGRNKVIAYDEILSSCGRLLEYNSTSGVVAIDIGSNVGVAVGQEFKVFSPTYSGKTKFFISDARTKRTLGMYPRVESARIVVFNAQPEISFAFVAAPIESKLEFDVGSHLEAIPAGSIGHLLPTSSKYFPIAETSLDRNTLSALREFIKASGSKKAGVFSVVVRFTRESDYLRKYGSVAFNMALAQLYREAQTTFKTAKFVEVIDRAAICIAGLKGAYAEQTVVDFADKTANEFPELGVFAGVFSDSDREESEKEGSGVLDPSNAIEFARFASSDAGRAPDSRVRHFNNKTAVAVLQALRASQSFDVAYADFELLARLGVDSASILNLGGLIAGSLGKRQKAMDCYAAAMAKDPSGPIYKSNFASAAYALGDYEAALKVLNPLPPETIEWIRKNHEHGFATYARLLARAKLTNSLYFDPEKFNEIAPLVLSIPKYATLAESSIIREALAQSSPDLSA